MLKISYLLSKKRNKTYSAQKTQSKERVTKRRNHFGHISIVSATKTTHIPLEIIREPFAEGHYCHSPTLGLSDMQLLKSYT